MWWFGLKGISGGGNKSQGIWSGIFTGLRGLAPANAVFINEIIAPLRIDALEVRDFAWRYSGRSFSGHRQ